MEPVPTAVGNPLGAGADGAWFPGRGRGEGEQVSLQRQ